MHPRLLVISGKYNPWFDVAEPQGYRRDLPNAQFTFSTRCILRLIQRRGQLRHWRTSS